MKLRTFLLSTVAAAIAYPAALFAQPVVSNVSFVQQPDGAGTTRVRVTYDLVSPNGPASVSLRYSTNGGTSFSAAATTTGAVGAGVAPGTGKTIDWAVATDLAGQQLTGSFVVRVLAEDGVPIPLTITSTLAESSVSQTANQTFTFTFGEGVTGFDSSDVAVAGGTKGTFTPVSATVYTLDVTGTGGMVTASVAAGAAQSASGSGNGNAADSYANFYQDTWTLTLPGSVAMELIRIPAGTFTAGSPVTELSRQTDESQHQVTISHDFYLGKTAVTQEQWTAIRTFPVAQSYADAAKPAHNVSYNDITHATTGFLKLTNDHISSSGQGPGSVMLPTEWQREYATRAGTTTRFSFGDGFGTDETCSTESERTDHMWYCGNLSPYGPKVVGQKLPNPWGLRDVHGGIWEWCSNFYDAYEAGPLTDPAGPGSGSSRVIRGGSWINDANYCRSAMRLPSAPTSRFSDIGFRVAAVRPITLTISSTTLNGAVTSSASQTLTFTFSHAVSDFDSSDVALTNATAGTFTAVSSTVYTLVIHAVADGAVSASLATNAVLTYAPFTRINGGSISNTYDSTAPTVSGRVPSSNATVNSLGTVQVTFSETVSGVTAGQLTVNGSAATSVSGSNPYTFSGYTAPIGGTVSVALAGGSIVDAAGNAFAGDSWQYSLEMLEFVSAPAGTFTMGRTDSGDDATYGNANELPNHQVTLSAFEIGKFEVTNAQFATVMNWALAEGYLANDTSGTPYSGGGNVYLMAPDASSTRQLLFDTTTGFTASQFEWSGSDFVARTRDSQSMGTHPVLRVSWYGAVAFCNFLSEIEGKPLAYNLSTWELVDADGIAPGLQYVASYRLPTESEWDYAAGWSGSARWIYGHQSDSAPGLDQANCLKPDLNRLNPMGLTAVPMSSPAGWFNGVNVSPNGSVATVNSTSPVGAYDMTGNAAEWVHDWFGSYDSSAKTNPTGATSGTTRVRRGGSWDELSRFCRTARRNSLAPNSLNNNIGFRVAIAR